MNTNEHIANIAEQLIEQIERLTMEQTVQASAYVALVRHLATQGFVDLTALGNDLETLGSTETDAGWQSGHAALAGALRLLDSAR